MALNSPHPHRPARLRGRVVADAAVAALLVSEGLEYEALVAFDVRLVRPRVVRIARRVVEQPRVELVAREVDVFALVQPPARGRGADEILEARPPDRAALTLEAAETVEQRRREVLRADPAVHEHGGVLVLVAVPEAGRDDARDFWRPEPLAEGGHVARRVEAWPVLAVELRPVLLPPAQARASERPERDVVVAGLAHAAEDEGLTLVAAARGLRLAHVHVARLVAGLVFPPGAVGVAVHQVLARRRSAEHLEDRAAARLGIVVIEERRPALWRGRRRREPAAEPEHAECVH